MKIDYKHMHKIWRKCMTWSFRGDKMWRSVLGWPAASVQLLTKDSAQWRWFSVSLTRLCWEREVRGCYATVLLRNPVFKLTCMYCNNGSDWTTRQNGDIQGCTNPRYAQLSLHLHVHHRLHIQCFAFHYKFNVSLAHYTLLLVLHSFFL
jgi:hypothetical protein